MHCITPCLVLSVPSSLIRVGDHEGNQSPPLLSVLTAKQITSRINRSCFARTRSREDFTHDRLDWTSMLQCGGHDCRVI